MWEEKDSGKSERDGKGDRIADKRDACVSPLCQLKRDSSLSLLWCPYRSFIFPHRSWSSFSQVNVSCTCGSIGVAISQVTACNIIARLANTVGAAESVL
ncbi:hypothetical protein DY000_02045571 [Brassica cretica]|uniref:Uncharacterized protein n=1 Tax=Brassica cretica TaxID=69181 RepID=A0ABQ7EUY3_BRACR|nr:hypothetical protein DY000_02045571 [Brassica cretica]